MTAAGPAVPPSTSDAPSEDSLGQEASAAQVRPRHPLSEGVASRLRRPGRPDGPPSRPGSVGAASLRFAADLGRPPRVRRRLATALPTATAAGGEVPVRRAAATAAVGVPRWWRPEPPAASLAELTDTSAHPSRALPRIVSAVPTREAPGGTAAAVAPRQVPVRRLDAVKAAGGMLVSRDLAPLRPPAPAPTSGSSPTGSAGAGSRPSAAGTPGSGAGIPALPGGGTGRSTGERSAGPAGGALAGPTPAPTAPTASVSVPASAAPPRFGPALTVRRRAAVSAAERARADMLVHPGLSPVARVRSGELPSSPARSMVHARLSPSSTLLAPAVRRAPVPSSPRSVVPGSGYSGRAAAEGALPPVVGRPAPSPVALLRRRAGSITPALAVQRLAPGPVPGAATTARAIPGSGSATAAATSGGALSAPAASCRGGSLSPISVPATPLPAAPLPPTRSPSARPAPAPPQPAVPQPVVSQPGGSQPPRSEGSVASSSVGAAAPVAAGASVAAPFSGDAGSGVEGSGVEGIARTGRPGMLAATLRRRPSSGAAIAPSAAWPSGLSTSVAAPSTGHDRTMPGGEPLRRALAEPAALVPGRAARPGLVAPAAPTVAAAGVLRRSTVATTPGATGTTSAGSTASTGSTGSTGSPGSAGAARATSSGEPAAAPEVAAATAPGAPSGQRTSPVAEAAGATAGPSAASPRALLRRWTVRSARGPQPPASSRAADVRSATFAAMGPGPAAPVAPLGAHRTRRAIAAGVDVPVRRRWTGRLRPAAVQLREGGQAPAGSQDSALAPAAASALPRSVGAGSTAAAGLGSSSSHPQLSQAEGGGRPSLVQRSSLATGVSAAADLVPATRVGVSASAPARVLRRAVLVPDPSARHRAIPPGGSAGEARASEQGLSPVLRLAPPAVGAASTPAQAGARSAGAVPGRAARPSVGAAPAGGVGEASPVRPVAVPVRRRPAVPAIGSPASLAGTSAGLAPALAGVVRRALSATSTSSSGAIHGALASSSSSSSSSSRVQGGPVPSSALSGASGGHRAHHPSAVPDHVRRFLDGDPAAGAMPSDIGADLSVPAAPTPRELTDAILADPESVARLVDVVGDAVERKIVRDLVRQGRAPYPGMV
ncbi:MAG: hypothetical protein ACTHOD_14215 [Motilibacteraceae bacterium]